MQIVLPALQPKQIAFLSDTHMHTAFGGARGGGKSFAIDIGAIVYASKYAKIRVTIARKTYPELYNNHVLPLKNLLQIGAPGNKIRYNQGNKTFTFPNGSEIRLKYCNTESDIDTWQGYETEILFIDEATLFSKAQLDAMRACVRGANDLPKHIFYTCNPNGQSMGYIKRLFIDRNYEDGEDPADYFFIQSLLTDNMALMRSNPEYRKQLESLPPKLKEAWLNGRWDVFEGAYFEEFRSTPDLKAISEIGVKEEDAKKYGIFTHVIYPYEIPKAAYIYRGYDWGYGKPFSVSWNYFSTDGVLYRILELYGCTKTPNEGVKWTNRQQMLEIKRIENEHPWLKGRKIFGIADPSIWDGSHDTDGISCAMEAEKCGLYFEKGNNERIAGWMQLHERMKFDEYGRAMFYVFDNCKAFIRCCPLMMYDEHKVEDLDTSLEDHCLDEARYVAMYRPIQPRVIKTNNRPISDPLDMFPKGTNQYVSRP